MTADSADPVAHTAHSALHKPGDDAATKPAATATILLVDDEPSVLNALRRLFRMQGYVVAQADSGAEGLKRLAEQPVDLVISDMRMPEMDGVAFLEAVRQRHPQTMRLLLTGYADMDATVAAVNRGEIHRYIAKPWDDHDLLLLVADVLKRSELERQNAALLVQTRQQNEELQNLNQTLERRVTARTAELEQVNGMLWAAYEDANLQFTMSIKVFTGLLELRQGGMAGRARRVSDLAGRTAGHLGLHGLERQEVELAALLHDIGMIGLPDDMLRLPVSQYDPAQMTRYQRHSVEGEALLTALEKLRGAALIVRQHHERVDGRGFPDGLTGSAICLGARIVAAASDFDELEAGILAEHAYSAPDARRALRAGVGSHYDGVVVEALFKALDELAVEAQADCVVGVHELRPHMVLAADLTSSQGAILLSAGYKFDSPMIKRVVELSQRLDMPLQLRVLLNSIEPQHLARLQAGRSLDLAGLDAAKPAIAA